MPSKLIGKALKIVTFSLLLLHITGLSAHEFWIDLRQGQINTGEKIIGDLKVGQMLKGESYPFLSNRFRSFTVTNGEQVTSVRGNEGDIPALSYLADKPGLHVVTQVSTAFRITYDDLESFSDYLDYEGQLEVLTSHRERGLPVTNFDERYIRHVKALVQVGPVVPLDSDSAVGMPLELVVQSNPYAASSDSLKVLLLWQGQPVAGRQINIFHATDEVRLTHVVTDQEGKAALPFSPVGKYLLNAVHILPDNKPPVFWESHWASLSFSFSLN